LYRKGNNGSGNKEKNTDNRTHKIEIKTHKTIEQNKKDKTN